MLGACESIPGLEDPVIGVAPYYAAYEVRGNTFMQSLDPVTMAIENNGTVDLENFGVNGRDNDVGIDVSLGDGFSGFELSYYRLDQVNQDKGRLNENWGNLLEDDLVRAVLEMDEFRLNYTAAILDQSWDFRDEEMRLQVGIGGTIAHREFVMRVREETGLLREDRVELADDGVLYGTARGRLSWRGASVGVDFGYSDDWNLGGDFKGVLQDLEINGRYELDYQNVAVFGGWRRSQIPAQGTRGDLRVNTDFEIQGFFLGLEFGF